MNANGRRWVVTTAGLFVLAASGVVAAADNVQPAWTKIEVFPTEIQLNTRRDRQSYIVLATRADGVTADVTGEADVKLANAKPARLEGHTLYPAADGKTTLEVAYGGHHAKVPVTVSEAELDRPVSFNLDVMPVFMRSGCNTGSCHGAARGKDGFMLSLFGYDPNGDHHRLTRELGFRRINLAVPAESLLLEKIDGTVPHTGGKRFDRNSRYYAAIHEWLEAGAPNDSGQVPKVVRVELYPRLAVLEGEGTTQQMLVRAFYTDGTDRDVTDLAVFITSNDNSAAVSEDGLVTAANRGEAFVMARFDTHTVGSQVLVLPKDLKYAPPQERPVNYIDELVNAKLERLRILPSALCTDEEFLRRATLDITGMLPTEAEYHEFMADGDRQKRSKLIDRLLDRREFAEIWAMKWAEVLLVRSNNQVSAKSIYQYATWLTEKLASGTPIDEVVRQLLVSSGGTFTNPATNYYFVERDTLKTAENTAQVFMGFRTQCAQCHNHPFDRWTMDDYYSFAAFFVQVGRKVSEDYRQTIVYDRRSGDTTHPVTRQRMAPKFLGGEAPDVTGKDRREVLAAWLTSPENPYFATNVANRVWDHFFGMGIVEPVDDVRISNPPSNPELYETLGRKLVEYKYDFRQLVRDICNSNTYQRSAERNVSNESDEVNFAHSRARRVRAEFLLDGICHVTEAKEKFRGLPLGARAVEIADGATTNYFLDTFGRSRRETVCACDVSTAPTLSQALHMLNGPTIEGKIQQGGVIRRLLAEKKTPQQIVETLYIRCLSRRPTDEELARLEPLLADGANQQQALEDVFWAILNSREFLFNH